VHFLSFDNPIQILVLPPTIRNLSLPFKLANLHIWPFPERKVSALYGCYVVIHAFNF